MAQIGFRNRRKTRREIAEYLVSSDAGSEQSEDHRFLFPDVPTRIGARRLRVLRRIDGFEARQQPLRRYAAFAL